MIGAQIEHRGGIEPQRVDSLQHVGRHFQDIQPVVAEQGQGQGSRPEVAAGRDVRPASARMWATSAVVVDLPLVPVTPMKRARDPVARTA